MDKIQRDRWIVLRGTMWTLGYTGSDLKGKRKQCVDEVENEDGNSGIRHQKFYFR